MYNPQQKWWQGRMEHSFHSTLQVNVWWQSSIYEPPRPISLLQVQSTFKNKVELGTKNYFPKSERVPHPLNTSTHTMFCFCDPCLQTSHMYRKRSNLWDHRSFQICLIDIWSQLSRCLYPLLLSVCSEDGFLFLDNALPLTITNDFNLCQYWSFLHMCSSCLSAF